MSDDQEHAVAPDQQREPAGEADKDDSAAGMDPKKRRLFIIGGAVVVAVILVIALIWWLNARNYESTDDAYIDARIVHLAPQVEGRVLHVLVTDNQRVRKGQLLVQIDPADPNARYDQVKAQVAQARAQLAEAEAQVGVSRANYRQALASGAGASAQASNAAEDLARYNGLRKAMPAAVAGQQFDQARSAAVNAAAQRDAAFKQASGAKAQIAAAQAKVQDAQAQLKTAQAQLEQAKITQGNSDIVAPVDGTTAQLSVAVGNYVSPGTQMLAIVPFNVWVTANFKESQLDLMRPGQKVAIKIDAYSDIDFRGHVDSIQRGAGQAFALLPAENATGNFVKVVQRVPVKIAIDGPKNANVVLGPGMSVSPTVRVR